MPKIAAFLALAALALSVSACGGNEAAPPSLFPGQAELDAQATAEAERNRSVSNAAQAMTRATVAASALSAKTPAAPSPTQTARPANSPEPPQTSTMTSLPTTARPMPEPQTNKPVSAARHAGNLYGCLKSDRRAETMFLQSALPSETASPQAVKEYETMLGLTIKSRNSFIQSYSDLISENPIAGPILAMAQHLCESLPDPN